MFCPKCSGDNDFGLSFCRHCGLDLKPVALAVDGRASESIDNFKRAGESLLSGLLTFAIFFVLAIIAYIPFGIWPAAIDLLLGLVFSVPQIIKGMISQRKAMKILVGKSRLSEGFIPPQLSGARTTESAESRPERAPSITEHTTFELEPPDSRR